MYPADVVDGYIRRAETTIARLEKELAEANDRAARAVRVLTGKIPFDDEASQDAQWQPARPDAGQEGQGGRQGVEDDALGQFLTALHEPRPSAQEAGPPTGADGDRAGGSRFL
jgi:hypothetical protein